MSDISFFYTNSLQVAMTQFDIVLEFLRQGAAGDPTRQGADIAPEVRDRLTVAMSPQHLKAMLPGLFVTVRSYEAQFGSIPVSAEVQQAFDAAVAAVPPAGKPK